MASTTSFEAKLSEAMRAHSEGRECHVASFDYGFQSRDSRTAIRVTHKGGGVTAIRIPAKTAIPWKDPGDRLLHFMGLIGSNYRQTTEEDAIKFAVKFVKKIVREDS